MATAAPRTSTSPARFDPINISTPRKFWYLRIIAVARWVTARFGLGSGSGHCYPRADAR